MTLRRGLSKDRLEQMNSHLDKLARQICYPAGVDYEGRPLVILSAPNFPDPKEVDQDELLAKVLGIMDTFVADQDYTIVAFCGGGQHRPSWPWVVSTYSSLGRSYRKHIKALYLVHSTWWVRVLFDLINHLVSPKFARKVTHVTNLSVLAEHVPLQQIDVPPAVYAHNLKYEAEIRLPPSHSSASSCFGVPLEELMGADGEKGLPFIVRDLTTYLSTQLEVEGLFRRSPTSNMLKIVREAYDRNQPVTLSDYGPHLSAVLLKLFLRSLPTPVLPPQTYSLLKKVPALSGAELSVFIRDALLPKLSTPTIIILASLCALLHEVNLHESENKMTSVNLATCLAPALIRHPSDPMADAQLCSPKSGGVAVFLVAAIDCVHEIFDLNGTNYATPATCSTQFYSSDTSPRSNLGDFAGAQEDDDTILVYHVRPEAFKQPPTAQELQEELTKVFAAKVLERKSSASPPLETTGPKTNGTSLTSLAMPTLQAARNGPQKEVLPSLSDFPSSSSAKCETSLSALTSDHLPPSSSAASTNMSRSNFSTLSRRAGITSSPTKYASLRRATSGPLTPSRPILTSTLFIEKSGAGVTTSPPHKSKPITVSLRSNSGGGSTNSSSMGGTGGSGGGVVNSLRALYEEKASVALEVERSISRGSDRRVSHESVGRSRPVSRSGSITDRR